MEEYLIFQFCVFDKGHRSRHPQVLNTYITKSKKDGQKYNKTANFMDYFNWDLNQNPSTQKATGYNFRLP